MDKLLSVIVPVYNVEQYIDRCVSSIVGQTYRNLEIILVDDGSTDSSGKICDAWAKKDERITVIYKANGGVSSARNAALEIMSGEYVTFVDADDWLDEAAYGKIMGKIEANHADAAFFGYVRVYIDNTAIVYTPQGKGVCVKSDTAFEKCLRNERHGGGYNTCVWNKVFHVSLIMREENVLHFDESITVAEDEIWLYHIFGKSFQVYCEPEVFYYYQERLDSAMGRRDVGAVNKQSLDNLRGRRKIYTLVRQKAYPYSVRVLADARMFNYTYQFLESTYSDVNKEVKRIVRQNFFWSLPGYMKSDNFSFLGKLRRILVVLLIYCNFPQGTVDYVIRLRKR